jgi:hypothetical protein
MYNNKKGNTMNSIQPNWQSSKIKSRLLKIRDMALYEFAYTNQREINTKQKIEPAFGQQQNKWSKYFMDLLISDANKSYQPGVYSKELVFSWSNLLWAFKQAELTSVEEIESLIGKDIDLQKVVNEDVSLSLLQPADKYAKNYFDLVDLQTNHRNLLSENAEYTEDETTTRLISGHQNSSKLVRSKFWAGWKDYDIEAASYCIIHQEALTKGLVTEGQLKSIESAYKDKDNFRKQLSAELNVPVKVVKMILAALAFNITLSKNPFSQLHKKLKKARISTSQLYRNAESCDLLQNLIADLKIIWPLLMTDWEKTTGKIGREVFRKESPVDKTTGEIKSRYSSAKFRACIYFRLERKVLDSIRNFMSDKVCHLMHDGFFTPEKVDLEKLRNHIKSQTSYEVQIKEEILGSPENMK